MDRIEALNRFLALTARRVEAQAGRRTLGVQPFVTISRESGAGGTRLGEEILRAFAARSGDPRFEGWQVVDRALCERVLEEANLNVSLRSLMDETTLNAVEDVISTLVGRTPQREVQQNVARTVRRLALVGRTILVGRGASTVTRDLATGLHLRLVAPLEVRVARKAAQDGGDEASVRRRVAALDRSRADWVKRLAHRRIDDPLLYDAVWNTERVPLEAIAASVVDWVGRQDVPVGHP